MGKTNDGERCSGRVAESMGRQPEVVGKDLEEVARGILDYISVE